MTQAKARKIHILLSEELHKRIRVRCAYEDRSIQDYVASLIAEDMDRHIPKGDAYLMAGKTSARRGGKVSRTQGGHRE